MSIKTNCEQCGKEITRKKYEYEKYPHHFCSKSCKSKSTSGIWKGQTKIPEITTVQEKLEDGFSRVFDEQKASRNPVAGYVLFWGIFFIVTLYLESESLKYFALGVLSVYIGEGIGSIFEKKKEGK